MGKRENCRERLRPLVETGDRPRLESHLLANSALPGRRANIELAFALADLYGERALEGEDREMLLAWAALSPEDAPANSRAEFLPFAATIALGASYLPSPEGRRGEVVSRLRAAARDARWRTREAAAFALQRIGEADFGELRRLLAQWLPRASHLERRCILVTLAHPPLFEGSRGEDAGRFAFEAADEVMRGFHELPRAGRQKDDAKTLRKALEFAPSVYVTSRPEEGFRFLMKWAALEDIDVRKIVAANVRKSRLARRFPEECGEVAEALSQGAD